MCQPNDVVKYCLGNGAQGDVVLVERGGKQIAVKTLASDEDVEFHQRLLPYLSHPNITEHYSVRHYSGYRGGVIEMEFCSGGSLFDRVLEMGCLDEAQAFIIFFQVSVVFL